MAVNPQSKLTLICVLITILLDMLGYGIILPVLPELIGQLTGGSVAQAAVIGGYLVFAYSLMQFLFGPALGLRLAGRQAGKAQVLAVRVAGLMLAGASGWALAHGLATAMGSDFCLPF